MSWEYSDGDRAEWCAIRLCMAPQQTRWIPFASGPDWLGSIGQKPGPMIVADRLASGPDPFGPNLT